MKKIVTPKFIIGLIFSSIGLYIAFKDFHYESFLELISKTNFVYIIIASFLLVFSVWLRAIRWHYLLLKEKKIKYKTLFEIAMVGFWGNNVLPLRLGELYRSILLSKVSKISKSTVIGSVVLERILDSIGLVFYSIFLLFYPLDYNIKKYIYYGLFFVFRNTHVFITKINSLC